MKLKSFLLTLTLIVFSAAISHAQGFRVRLKVPSEALKNNLINNPSNRDITVYLPPSYQTNLDKKYPVLYFLHGFTDSDSKWFGWEHHWINLYELLNKNMTNGTVKEMIVVMPNAYTTFKGSFYGKSETMGDWETFITKELVNFIDLKYRTLPNAESRGLAGHSMGGYGTLRLGMKYPEVYSAMYALSPCCMEESFIPSAENIKNMEAVNSKSGVADVSFVESINMAFSAAWASNPKKFPLYIDLAYKDGKPRPEILEKFKNNQILYTVDQYIDNLKTYKAIAIDAGTDDTAIFEASNKLHTLLSNHQVEHTYESYKGDHTNKIADRITTKTLPFFSEHLKFEQD
ncbi:carbohydrate esterase (CE1) [Formosa agariphila KMM 3901]|uniref:Carbohydrate esterase (CE1) n=1 Tax=Formosa agariphila (strain DSM 15362 / KCTC 12365 / LMG 23005 / KMM 3901 / M-2Alg 35-1) TaxID=1347342 RepID=T2KLX0_FORAG|nr:alpha/beta hydrolase-fold protein [Formosa agariphila]CDF78999.1 carbohydrate esterase (CE1) [Formosa agariphila KMM 3901]